MLRHAARLGIVLAAGVGLVSSGAFTLQNCPPGSPAYVAPEVVIQKPYDAPQSLAVCGSCCGKQGRPNVRRISSEVSCLWDCSAMLQGVQNLGLCAEGGM